MRALWAFSTAGAVALACSGARFEGSAQGPAVSMPTRIAEGSDQDAGVGDAAPDGRPLVGAAERGQRLGSQPDPEALKEARHFVYEVIYDRGKVRIGRVRAVRFKHAVPAPRKMGRFALELWLGRELIERVRFDFPLVAAEDPRKKKAHPHHEPPSFASGVTASLEVLVPASARATRAVLVDRATGSHEELPWPPDAPLGPAAFELPRAGGETADASVAPIPDGAAEGGAD